MGLTSEQAKSIGLGHLHPAASGEGRSKEREMLGSPAKRSGKPASGPNKTECRFARVLDAMKSDGLILGYGFESMKFRMADRTWWTPDFMVVLPDWMVIVVEVKAVNRDGSVRWTDDGAVKAKTVPEMHPFAFFLAAWDAPRWRITRLPSRNYGCINVDLEWRT